MYRPDKNDYYLNIADAVLARSTCLKRHYGAVIVNHDEIISTGYNGNVRGMTNCCDRGECFRANLPRGTGYDSPQCSVHAEANAIISAARKDMIGADLYLCGRNPDGSLVENAAPCNQCIRLIANAGISRVFVRNGDNTVKEIVIAKWITKGNDLYMKDNNTN